MLSCHASCHAPLSCPPSMPLPCPSIPPCPLPCPPSCPPSCHAPDVRSRSCVPAVPSLLPCPCRTFPVVHSFLRSCRARSLRNEIHWSALSCATAVPVLTFPSPHHDGGTNFSPTLQSWGSAICSGPQVNRKPVHLSFIFPIFYLWTDIGEAQHRAKTSNINDDHFCLIQGDIQSFVK